MEKLSQTDDELALRITEGMSGKWLVWSTRLRNGDISAGLDWITYENERSFLPSVRFSFFESAILACSVAFNDKREYLSSELAAAIKLDKWRDAALTFGGYIQWPELLEPIWYQWSLLSDKEKTASIAYCTWFLSRNEHRDIYTKLEETLLLVLNISDENPEPQYASERHDEFEEPLRLSLWRGFSSSAAEAWANVFINHNDLRETLHNLLGGIDHPATLEAFIMHRGEYRYLDTWDLMVETVDPLAENTPRYTIPVNYDSRSHMWSIVNTNEDINIRKYALAFWKRSIQPSDLRMLQAIQPKDPIFDDVLKIRLKMRDRSAKDMLIDKIQQDPGHWCRFAPLLANEKGVFEVLLANLEIAYSSNHRYWAEYIIQNLPTEQVKTIIKLKKDIILANPLVWPSLWYSAVPEALLFLQSIIDQADESQLKHFFFGGGSVRAISRIMLNALVPILHKFPEDELRRLAELALKSGHLGWVQEHLPQEITEAKGWYTSLYSQEKIISVLDEIADTISLGIDSVFKKSNFFSLEMFLKEVDRSHVNIISILQRWINDHLILNQLVVAAMLVARFGTYNDTVWWHQLYTKYDLTHDVLKICENTLYILQRRRWQESDITEV